MWCVTAFADDPAGHAVGERGDISPGFLRPRAAPSRHPHHLVVADRVNAEFLAAEETLARVEDGLEHRRRIRDGFADRAEHLGRGLLLLQRLLRLVEKPRVLDRDQRLVAKRFGVGDFAWAKAVRPTSGNHQHANALVVAEHWQVEGGVDAERLMDVAFVFGQIDLRPVGQVQHRLGEERARGKVGVRIDGNVRARGRSSAPPASPRRMEVGVASRSSTNAMSHWSRRAAATTIRSNTGRASVGDWLMTRKISAVAVCCWRASASSASRSASAAARSWRGGLVAFFAADDALRVRDIALPSSDS